MENETFLIRRVREGDAQALLAVYAPYITGSAVTFEYTVPAADEFARRVRQIAAFYPYLVCERSGEIIGYAYADRLRGRAAYDWAAELSIYLAPGAQGRGIGTTLLACLIRLLEKQGLRRLYSCVTLPNEKSCRMQKKLGFEAAGAWHSVGWKFGAWHSVGWMEKQIGSGEPKPPVPFDALGEDTVRQILEQYTAILNREE